MASHRHTLKPCGPRNKRNEHKKRIHLSCGSEDWILLLRKKLCTQTCDKICVLTQSCNQPQEDVIKLDRWFFDKNSSSEWLRLRALVYKLLRLRSSKTNTPRASLISDSETFLFKLSQEQAFSQDMCSIRENVPVALKSRLTVFSSFLDANNVIRPPVGWKTLPLLSAQLLLHY